MFEFFILIGVIVLLIVIVVKVNKNSQRIEELQWQLVRMKKLLESGTEKPPVESPASEKEQKAKIESPPPAQSVKPAGISFDDLSSQTAKPAGISFDDLSSSAAESAEEKIIKELKSKRSNEWEILIGGKVLNRIGAVAIILGVSFFLKYAFDNDWISEAWRVIIGGIIGFLFIGGGLRAFQKDYKIFSQGLSGTGISILYLSVYASFNYYYLLSQPVAFILMSAVTILTFAQAIYFNSMAVSLIGLLGGFFTPFLLSTGQSNEVGLFSYLALLNVGLILVAMRKSAWMILESIAVAATYIIYFAWYFEYFDGDKAGVSIIFLTIFWAIFFTANIIHILKSSTFNRELQLITASFNLFLYSMALYIVVDDVYPDWTGAAAAMLSIVHLGYFLYLRKSRDTFDDESNFALLSSIILFSLFIYLQFTDYTIVILWSFNILLLIWLGTKFKHRITIISAMVLTAFTLLEFISIEGALYYAEINEFSLLLSVRTLAYLSITIVFGMSAYLLKTFGQNNLRLLNSGYLFLLCTTFFVFITVETNDFFRLMQVNNRNIDPDVIAFREFLTLSGIWVYYSLVLVFTGYRLKLSELIISGIGSMGIGVLLAVFTGITFKPIEDFNMLVNLRAAILILITLSISTHIFLLKSSGKIYHWLEGFYKVLQVTMVILLFTLVTAEIKDFYNREIFLLSSSAEDYNDNLSRLENLQQMLLSTSWLILSSIMIIIGILKRIRIIRISAIALFGFAILKMFLYDLSFLDTVYRIISFIGLGLILLAASFIYQKYKKFIFS